MSTLSRNTAESLRALPFIPPEVDAAIHGVIFVSSNLPEGPPPDPERMAKLPQLLESVSRWHRSLRERRIRYVEFALPERREFERGKCTPEEAIGLFWGCIEVDRMRIRQRAEILLGLMSGDPRLRFTSSRGTDLALEVDLERAFILDGRIDPDDLEHGRVYEELPAGTLNFFPVPGKINGVYYADYTFLGGLHIEGVLVKIRRGRIVDVHARRNEDTLRRRLESAKGDGDLISGIRFGLNPAGRGPTGKSVLDACLSGAVTLQFGNNELQGGDVKSTIDLILPAFRLKVTSGARSLVSGGNLQGPIGEA